MRTRIRQEIDLIGLTYDELVELRYGLTVVIDQATNGVSLTVMELHERLDGAVLAMERNM